MNSSQAAPRLKELMAQLVRGEVDGMCWHIPQQGDAPAPVQPCHVSTHYEEAESAVTCHGLPQAELLCGFILSVQTGALLAYTHKLTSLPTAVLPRD